MAKKPDPQSPQIELALQNATPESSDEAAKAADPDKRQKYLPVLIPLRANIVIASLMKSDHIRLFDVDTDGPGGEEAAKGYYERKASKREETTSVDDSSAESTPVASYIVAKGSRGGLPRGKVIIVPTGRVTEGTKAGRFAYIRVPARMHAIEVANWIDKCFRAKIQGEPLKTFRMGRSEYSVKALAPLISKLPAFKKPKA